ncbi:hypothetical protein ACFXDE_02005 [Kitasatospora sp. NPDC059408]|uniref:hypothetical protein n=1 Tax=Kitasatospora sp. NPDC059408 TaxID=3346823 RepID=UPI00367CCE5B
MTAALLWVIPAACALTLLAVLRPRDAVVTLRAAAGIWIALTLIALPLLLRS